MIKMIRGRFCITLSKSSFSVKSKKEAPLSCDSDASGWNYSTINQQTTPSTLYHS
jgi:hypothetical protein